MLSTIPSYIEAIGEGFPTVQVSSLGDGTNYDMLVWSAGDPMPTKAALDTYILALTKKNMWRLIQDEREDRSQRGGYKVGTNWYHSDQAVFGRAEFHRASMMASATPATYNFSGGWPQSFEESLVV